MDRLLLSLFFLLLSSSLALSSLLVNGEEDPLIRQVVPVADDLVLNAEAHFTSFKQKFGKSYATAEEHDYRLGVFKANMRRARRHQKLDPTAVHGITQFSDLTPKEFKRSFLGLRKRRPNLKGAHQAPILPTNDLPKDFDWREKGAVTEVKNQGNCGSCWSFSASGALEGANFLATGELVSLSEQQMVDCDHECDPSEPADCDEGCNGGLMTTAFEYLLKAGGLEREKDYPYTGTDGGTCKFDKSKIAAKVSNFSVVSINEDQIAANLVKHGPLAIGIHSAYMQTYIGGVSCPYICMHHLDHGVLLVGYGSAGFSPIRLKEKPYWIIKNSWGKSWGENGYYKLCRGHNVCAEAHAHLTAATRKAPSSPCAVGFSQTATKLLLVVELLMGDIPDRLTFRLPTLELSLHPYFLLVQAVRVGNLEDFETTIADHADTFRREGTYSLILRLRQNVIKTGIRMMSLSYSRISLRDICIRLHLGSEESAEYIVAKAIRDGVIEATLDRERGFMKSKEIGDVYATREPGEAFHDRIRVCLALHDESVKAMRFPMNQHRLELKNAQEAREREREMAKEIQEGDLDDEDLGGEYEGM